MQKIIQLRRRIVYAMVFFAVCFSACFLLVPSWTTFSSYGTMLKTWPFFALGMSALAYILWQFADALQQYGINKYRNLLRLSAAMAILLIFAPYTAGNAGRITHNLLSLSLAAIIFILSIALAMKKQHKITWLFVSFQVLSLSMCAFCFIFLLQTSSVLWGIFEPLFFIGTAGIIIATFEKN